jgi:hypothetical protein
LELCLPPSPLMLDDRHIAEPRIEFRLLSPPPHSLDQLGFDGFLNETATKPINPPAGQPASLGIEYPRLFAYLAA